MSEDLIEIKCTKCGRTILVRDRWDTCPVSDCLTRLAGYDDDMLDMAVDEIREEMKTTVMRMEFLRERLYKRLHEVKMTDKTKYYLCTFLKQGNVYDVVAMDIDPIEYILDSANSNNALINAHEITKEQYDRVEHAAKNR